MMHKLNMLNSARDNGWKLVKTADVEIDGGEITDATLYEKDGIYMMVVRGESNYGPDEDYAEWDTDNYKEAITKFREFVTEHRKRNKKSQQLRAARDERTATCKLIIRTDYNSMSVKQIYDYIVDDINKLEPDINYKITLKPGAGMWKGLAYDLTIQSDEKDINRIKQLIGVCAIVSDLKFWKLNSSRKGVNMKNRKLNSSVANSYMDVYDEVADVVREVVFDHIVDILDECNIANITSRVPEYNGDWCATEWTTDDDDKKFEISDALVDFVLDGLFRHAGNELEIKFKEK